MSESKEVKRIIPGNGEEIEAWLGLSEIAKEEEELEELESPKAPSLRPDNFAEYVGQDQVKENLKIACEAAQKRGEPLDHILFHGPPGLGKTSLARIISREMNTGFKATSGPVLERAGDLAAVLTSLNAMDVLFIDEIHRLPRSVEEVLYPAMEDYRIDIMIGSGPTARSIQVGLKPFTLVGATTRTGLLTSPLRDRFGMVMRLDFYSAQEIFDILIRSAAILNVEIENQAAKEISERARGTPRIANRLLKRIRDYAQTKGDGKITLALARHALQKLDIDPLGLDKMDRSILAMIIDTFSGGPVGIEALAAALGEDKETLEEVYEPFLLQRGMIARTRRGREATQAAYEHIGRVAPLKVEPPKVASPKKADNLSLF